MSEKRVLWIIGSFASGKSTQNKNIFYSVGTEKPNVVTGQVGGIDFSYVENNGIATIGSLNKSGEPSGIDAVSKDKVPCIDFGVQQALKKNDLVIVEGAPQSFQWYKKALEKHKDILYVANIKLPY